MTRLIRSSFTIVVYMALLTTIVWASQFLINFTASNSSNQTGSTPAPYSYATQSVPGRTWQSYSLDSFNLKSILEPSTLLLLGSGLAGVTFAVRRRRKE